MVSWTASWKSSQVLGLPPPEFLRHVSARTAERLELLGEELRQRGSLRAHDQVDVGDAGIDQAVSWFLTIKMAAATIAAAARRNQPPLLAAFRWMVAEKRSTSPTRGSSASVAAGPNRTLAQ